MSKQNAHANELLRRRDSLRKSRQLWIAGLAIWAVVLGWVLFGLVNSITDDVDVRLSWTLVWLVPVLILGIGTLLTMSRLRRCEAALVDVERTA